MLPACIIIMAMAAEIFGVAYASYYAPHFIRGVIQAYSAAGRHGRREI